MTINRSLIIAKSRVLDLCMIKAKNAIKNNLSVVNEIIKTTDAIASKSIN
jgi:hypothetical protein